MDTQTYISTDGKFAVDFDMSNPMLAFAASIMSPEELAKALSADEGQRFTLQYADEHNLSLDEALREVNAGSTWATIRALS